MHKHDARNACWKHTRMLQRMCFLKKLVGSDMEKKAFCQNSDKFVYGVI